MYTVKTTNSNLFRGSAIYRDIIANNINDAYRKVMMRNIAACSVNDPAYNVNVYDITEENVLELANKYGYTLTDLTAEYQPEFTIIRGDK